MSEQTSLFSNLLLRKFYEEKLKEHLDRINELKDEKIIYITDLVYCPLKREFRRQYTEISFQFEPYMVLGDMVHKGIQEYLSDMGYEIEKEISKDVEVEGTSFTLKGRMDAFSPNRIVEIKTARSGSNLPQPHHLMQLRLYLAIAGVAKGTLIYVTPDRYVEHEVNSENIDVQSIVKKHVKKENIPMWEWECRNCIYSKFCPYRNL
jgi:CRISPR-associated protein Cas4